MDNTARFDSINSGITDGTHLSLQPQMDVTFASQTTRTARKINTSEYQVLHQITLMNQKNIQKINASLIK